MTAIMQTTVGTNSNDMGEYQSLIRQLRARSGPSGSYSRSPSRNIANGSIEDIPAGRQRLWRGHMKEPLCLPSQPGFKNTIGVRSLNNTVETQQGIRP